MNISPSCHLLQRQLERIRINNADFKKFVAEGRLQEVMARGIISEIVEETSLPSNVQEMVDYILGSAQKIFGVLVLISYPACIRNFVRDDQLQTRHVDDLLPFRKNRLEEIFHDDHVASLFFDRQWEFSVPVFSGRIIPRLLESQTILPYLIDSPLTEGGYGSVYKIKIHTAHQPHDYGPTAMFVRKELKLNDLTYENEVQTLSTLQRLKHPHILRLIGCYTFKSKHNLISPYVADGTLKEYLENPKPADFCKEKLFCSISGLASAIWALHEFVLEDTEPSLKGHHQDLRADNVLVDGDRFILADFGLSSIKLIQEDSRTPFKGRRGYCQAPECADLKYPYQEYETTRKTDIYALACIMADLLVYSVKGPRGVEAFLTDRQFEKSPMRYSLYHKGDSANSAVSTLLEDLVSEDQSQSLRDMVDLVIKMLEILPENRPSAAIVTARLYVNTIRAFSEQFRLLFNKFTSSPDALIEDARLTSWAMSHDVEFYSSSSDATTTGRYFDSTIDILRQMKTALESIDETAPDLDCRSFIEVRTLNTQLLNTLSSERRSSAQSRLESIILESIRPDRQGETYTTIRDALGDSYLNRRAETQHLVSQVENATAPLPTPTFRLLKGPAGYVRAIGRHHVAELRDKKDTLNKSVIVEIIQYQDQLRRQRVLPRIHALCELLSSEHLGQELRIPKFYGLYDNKEAFCFEMVYEILRGHRPEDLQAEPISLRELLTDRERSHFPSLETRLRLGLELAESLAAFHDVTWYHKDLTSFNVLFSPTLQIAKSARATHPYLIGFQHSRSAADDFTEGPLQDRSHQRYHHPRYISSETRDFTKFRTQFDWYSLGILLIEIGLWDTIDNCMKEYAQMDNSAFSDTLINHKLSDLSFNVGDEYADIVKACLTGLNEKPENTDDMEQLNHATNLRLKEQVVIPLKSLDRTHPTQGGVDKKRKQGGIEGPISTRLTQKRKRL